MNFIDIAVAIILLILAAFLAYPVINLYKERTKQIEFKLPDIEEIEKPKNWEVKKFTEIKKIKKKNKDNIIVNDEAPEEDLEETFSEIYNFSKKITIHRLPKNILQIEKEELTDNEHKKEEYTFNIGENSEFEALLADLTMSADKIEKIIEERQEN